MSHPHPHIQPLQDFFLAPQVMAEQISAFLRSALLEEMHLLMTQLRGEITAELRAMHRQELTNLSLQTLGREGAPPPRGRARAARALQWNGSKGSCL